MLSSRPLMEKSDYPYQDDWSLIEQAQSGDHRAFEEIYRIHVGRVYGICLRILANPSSAEEMTQKIFIRAWVKLNSFRRESSFSTWLYRLSANLILGELKMVGEKNEVSLEDNDRRRFIITGSALSQDLRLDLNKAISSLPKQARIVFVLHDIDGFTHEEIADVMDLAVGTCKAHLFRARKLLREALEP